MGCDITLHVEIKVKGKWLHWNQPRIARDYKLFTKMANVCPSDEEEITPICEPKGFPVEKITKSTLFHFDYEKADAHSISWFDSFEIAELGKWYDSRPRFKSLDFENTFGYLLGNQLNIHEFPEDFARSGIEDVRFIFWFMG